VWWVNYYESGQRHREKVGRRSDAIDLYHTRKADARAGRKLPVLRATQAVTISNLIDLAIAFTADHKDKRNYISKGGIVRQQLGDRKATEITPQEIEQWLSKRCRTSATANRYRAFLSLCYRLGMANGKVEKNPVRLVRQRKENGARFRYLTRYEYDRLCAVIQERFPQHLAEFVASVNTGMRLTEQYTCTWAQVDRQRQVIRLTETKNGSARSVHLNADALAAIESLRFSAQKSSDKVFPRERDAERFDTRSWFHPCLKEAGIEGYVWHCNRHTFCSWLAMAGATIKEIQELAGHKTITMSARYAHLSPDHRLSVIERISGTAIQQPTKQRGKASTGQTATKTATRIPKR
jgi:site-specific recombinase XerD